MVKLAGNAFEQTLACSTGQVMIIDSPDCLILMTDGNFANDI